MRQDQQAAVAAVEGAGRLQLGAMIPDHYLAPEGSYAVNPGPAGEGVSRDGDGFCTTRVCGVIQDVVFNHTSGFGEATNSILDEVVPDYYNRLDMDWEPGDGILLRRYRHRALHDGQAAAGC